jgi:hypothetical protein
MSLEQDKLNFAVFYALRHGCFFPVRRPEGKRATVKNLTKWGALSYLHTAIAEFDRAKAKADGLAPTADQP